VVLILGEATKAVKILKIHHVTSIPAPNNVEVILRGNSIANLKRPKKIAEAANV